MRSKRVGYWVATALFCLLFTVAGVANLVHAEPQAEAMSHLGYPAYLMTLLGIAKLLGVVALLSPGFALLKEWAYAGFAFDMIGAAFSHASVGDPVFSVIFPLLVLLLGATSYGLRPEQRRLSG